MNLIKKNLHLLYLFLSIFGGAFTFYFALQGIIQNQGHFDSIAFIKSTWTENYYAKSITLDFWTGTISGTLLMLIEGIRIKLKKLWLYLFLTVFIGFAFGFPLFLFVRHRMLQNIKS